MERRGVLNALLSRTLLEKKIGASAGVNKRITAVTGRGPRLDNRFLGVGITAAHLRIEGKYQDWTGLLAVEKGHEGVVTL